MLHRHEFSVSHQGDDRLFLLCTVHNSCGKVYYTYVMWHGERTNYAHADGKLFNNTIITHEMTAKSKQREQQRITTESAQSEQLSLREVEERFGIPKSTIHDLLKGHGRQIGAGRPTTLSTEVERAIVRLCQELAQPGFGVD